MKREGWFWVAVVAAIVVAHLYFGRPPAAVGLTDP
jgi:hypothetical protein